VGTRWVKGAQKDASLFRGDNEVRKAGIGKGERGGTMPDPRLQHRNPGVLALEELGGVGEKGPREGRVLPGKKHSNSLVLN